MTRDELIDKHLSAMITEAIEEGRKVWPVDSVRVYEHFAMPGNERHAAQHISFGCDGPHGDGQLSRSRPDPLIAALGAVDGFRNWNVVFCRHPDGGVLWRTRPQVVRSETFEVRWTVFFRLSIVPKEALEMFLFHPDGPRHDVMEMVPA